MNSNNSTFKILKKIINEIVLVVVYIARESWKTIKRQYERFIEKQRFSITFKITLAHVHKTLSILTSFGFFIILGFIIYQGWNAQGNMDRDYNIVGDYLKESSEVPVDRIKRLAAYNNLTITLFDKDRNILYSTAKTPVTFFDKNYRRDKLKINKGYMLGLTNEPLYYKWDLNFDNEEYNLGFLMALNEKLTWNNQEVYIQLQTKMIKEFISLLILTGAILILDFLFIISVISSGARASKKILKPVEAMTKTVENITINEIATRLNVSGSQDELKDLARTFNSMLDRLQQSYEQQNQFVSDASHELRTPIAVVQGYANLLDRWGKNDEKILEESITAIKTEAENMKDLVEKLLFLARGDKNTQKVEMKAFSLKVLIDEVVKESRLIDSTHEIKCEKNEEISINADSRLLKEAIRVFVDNSIKYTPEGGIISISSFIQNNEAVIIIEDTGVGISKEDLPHIFDRFYRADKSRTRQTGGTGLGLSIAKWIILKHNGKIDVKSELGMGTKVSITMAAI